MDLGKGLRQALAKITGAALVDENAVKELSHELQRVLISNDVNVRLVFELTKRIEEKALDKNLPKGLSVREHVVQVVYDELVALMGEKYEPNLKPRRLLLLGLYGSGKTTTCGKLAAFYKKRGLSVALVSCDVDRPAAYQQLQQLAKQTGAEFYGIDGEKDVKKILALELPKAKEDLVIVDSAGRSGFDEQLVAQLKDIVSGFSPDEKILVMSADIGQVAGRQAREFHEAVALTGVILTKLDGSGKGGGALSACRTSGAKVLFAGMGEKMEDLSPFDSKKFVGRLLGFPDLEALLDKVRSVAQEEKLGSEMPEKLTLDAFYQQLKAAKKMGPLSSVFGMMGMQDLPADALKTSEGKLKKYEAIIGSMTKYEKENAEVLRKQKSRMERIAKGSGCKMEDVRELLTTFEKISGMMDGFKKNRGMRKKLEKMFGKAGVDFDKMQKSMEKQS